MTSLAMRAICAGLLLGSVGEAADEPRRPEEVIIYGDRFARWDHTRWYAEQQIGFPLPYLLLGRVNSEARLTHLQVRAAFLCDKTWRRGARQFEVLCDIEGVGLQAVLFDRHNDKADEVLRDLDDDLTDTKLRLYVTDSGKIENVDFEGFPAADRRQGIRRENIRQIFVRLMASFHMKLPEPSLMLDGQWVEYDSELFLLPTPLLLISGSKAMPGEAAVQPRIAGMSGSELLHQLDAYKGMLVVQSVGKGLLSDAAVVGEDSYYAVKFNGVALYDPDTGIMTERVYALHGRATASSPSSEIGPGAIYFHTGRIRQLDEQAVVDVGPTGVAAPPGVAAVGGGLAWVPME
jgi:hypothetical protein